MEGGPLHQRGRWRVHRRPTRSRNVMSVARPLRETNSIRPAFHRFRAGHPQGRSEAEDPGGEAGGVDGRGRGGRLGMLRTGGRLTRRGLAGPCARGHGGGGPRAPPAWITRARLRRASGVAAARARSAPAVDRGRVVRLLHGEGRGAEGGDRRARVAQARAFARTSRAGLLHGEGRGGECRTASRADEGRFTSPCSPHARLFRRRALPTPSSGGRERARYIA